MQPWLALNKRLTMSSYFDQRGLLGPQGENSIIFTSQYYSLLLLSSDSKKRDFLKENYSASLINALESLRSGHNSFQSDDPREPWSHDNHSALIAISQIYSLEYHKKFSWKGWWRRAHPRDLIFYVHSLGGFRGLLALPFIPLLSLIMLFGALPSYKNIDGDKVLATDGKLLSWLRLQTGNYPITNYIYNHLIKEHYGSWTNIFSVYFKDKDHPNNVYARLVYEVPR